MLSKLREIEDDEPLDQELEGGVLPEEWRLERRVGITLLDSSLKFADFEAPETASVLRRELAPVLTDMGMDDLDFSDLAGRERRITQEAAKCVYEATGGTDKHLFDGIRYVSRLNPGWELWAIFADRLVHKPEDLYHTITRDNPDLREAAETLEIEIE